MGKILGMSVVIQFIRKPYPSLAACAAADHTYHTLLPSHSLPNCRMTNRHVFLSKYDTACTVDVKFESLTFSRTVVVCLLHLVSVVRSQSCSATVFGTDLQETHSSARKGLFINTQSPASCSGILTLWHYCFYNENAGDTGRAKFSIYRRDSANSYSRVYREDQVSVSIPSSSFSCRTLIPSQSNFQVEPEDIILACIPSNNPLDVLAESASGYEVYASRTSIGGCGSSDISDSVSLSDSDSYELLSDSAVHVYAGEYGLP